MRTVRLSFTANDQLNELLAQGEAHFSDRIIDEKRRLVYEALEDHVAVFPAASLRDAHLGLRLHAVAKTPFVVVYDFTDTEARVHFVLHEKADRRRIDPSNVEW
jgi:hypothetical protein